MHPPSRTRRIFKWTGAGLSLLILLAWVVSLWCGFAALPAQGCRISAGQGEFDVAIATFDLSYKGTGFFTFPRSNLGFKQPRVRYEESISPLGMHHVYLVELPYWLLFLLTAIPTAWLWHRDRRLFSSPPDHLSCRGCGYDLTGNLSGVCPECGEKTARREETVESRK